MSKDKKQFDNPIDEFNASGATQGGEPLTAIHAKGREFLAVARVMGGDEDMYWPAVMHVIFRVGGKQRAPQAWLDDSWEDFTRNMQTLIGLGFSPGGQAV